MKGQSVLKPLSCGDINARIDIEQSLPINKRKFEENAEEDTISKYAQLKEKFFGLSEGILHDLQNKHMQPALEALLSLKETDFSEEDPFMLIVPMLHDNNSIAFCNEGNYGLPPGAAGHRAWPGKVGIIAAWNISLRASLFHIGGVSPPLGVPLPLGVNAVPPNAFGQFIAQQHGFVDKTGGYCQAFHVASLHDYNEASRALHTSLQFVRYGPFTAGQMRIPPQPPLVNVYLLVSMQSQEQHMTEFAYVA